MNFLLKIEWLLTTNYNYNALTHLFKIPIIGTYIVENIKKNIQYSNKCTE